MGLATTISNPFQAGVAVAELGIGHRVAAHNLAFHVVDDHVHAGDGVAGAGEFLAVELERTRNLALTLNQGEFAFDEQTGRAAGEIADLLALTRADDVGDEPADFLRREKFAGALPWLSANLRSRYS